MKTCAELTQLLSEAQDKKLSFADKWATRAHLMMCRGCRNYEKQLNFLREAVRGYARGRADDRNQDRMENPKDKKIPDSQS
jgi:hypothetical protein